MTVVRGTGVFLDGRVCSLLWPALRATLADQQARNGGRARPEVVEAVNDMRLAASEFLTYQQLMSASGQVSRTSADIAPLLLRAKSDDLTANELGDQLHVTGRHARRLAAAAGIEPRSSRPARWAKADVAILLEQYR